MSTVAVLSQGIPITPEQPGSPHLFYLGREWAKANSLILICQCAPAELHPSVAAQYAAVEFLPRCPEPSVVGKLRHRLSRGAFFVQRYRNPSALADLRAQVSRLLRKYEANHLHVAQLSISELIPDGVTPESVTINITDDPSLFYRREAALSRSWRERFGLLEEDRSLGRYLQSLSRAEYRLFVVGDADRTNLASRWGIHSDLAPLGIDVEYFRRDPAVQRKPRAVFTGVMNYGPNIDTARFFAEQILPILHRERPELAFDIVGANPAEEVLALAQLPGVRVTGTVADIRPYLDEASVFVSPMRSGAGIKNKILAAMAMELPVVASQLGVAGINVASPTHCLISEEPLTFAEHVLRVLDGGPEVERMVDQAHNFVVEKHAWPAMAGIISKYFRKTLIQK